jgi:hypothetical protein
MKDTHDLARIILACIRLFNGAAALFAPLFLARQVGIDADQNPAALYVFRMFGIRTVLIAFDLFQKKPDAVRVAPLIHASDTVAAGLAAVTGRVPRSIVVISAINTALAVWASR